MIRPVIGTIGTRVVSMACNLLVLAVAGHALGTEGLGEIGLIVLGIALIMVLNNVVGGGALVYLAPRFPMARLLRPAYFWALFTAVVAMMVLHILPLVPKAHVWHVVVLAFVQSLYTAHHGILLGHERIRAYNTIVAVQSVVLLVTFITLTRISPVAHVGHYITASYVSFGCGFLFSSLVLRGLADREPQPGGNAWRALFKHGGLVQVANLTQLLNYRLAYYLVEAFRGTAALGLYSVAIQLAESAWLVPKSLGMVLYARVSNMEEADRQRDITLTIMKGASAFALLVAAVLLLLPDPLFQWVFGPEVTGLTPLVFLLLPGLLAMAASQALSHWYSGTGRNGHNAIGSGIGSFFTVVAGLILIPLHGLPGAAITASLAYCANTTYQLITFMHLTGSRVRHLLPNPDDARHLREAWQQMRRIDTGSRP